ncbi:S-layer homology domain-containing protein [Ferviditalea candida]|uniref:S-layer homology domain-containing protein n=1 Tax=Ferviditalea candida TaxID=3108399 RepID=A0ABU5ZIH9_9BACL|nr:S-layer homology domain-containing protein [Paenibacillaceae bacterium T2]
MKMKRFFYSGVLAASIFALLALQVKAIGPGGLSDISGHWAKAAIQNAVANGYVAGYPDGTFQPDAQVTRAEFIKMAVDALKLPHSQGGTPWYQPYVSAAVEVGIHQEKDFNTDWNKPLTRMEMARIAVRATDSTLQKPDARLDDKSFMYRATNNGIIQGMENGELQPAGLSTRAQAVAIIERILTVKNGGKLPVDQRAVTYAQVDIKGTNVDTLLGLQLKPFPIHLNLRKDVDVYVDKIIAVDMTDPNAPYRDWFPKTIRVKDRSSADNCILFAMHLNVINNNDKDHSIFNYEFSVEGTNGDYQRTGIPYEYYESGKTPIHPVDSIILDTKKDSEGWYVISVEKEKYLYNPANKIIRIYDMIHQRFINFTLE